MDNTTVLCGVKSFARVPPTQRSVCICNASARQKIPQLAHEQLVVSCRSASDDVFNIRSVNHAAQMVFDDVSNINPVPHFLAHHHWIGAIEAIRLGAYS